MEAWYEVSFPVINNLGTPSSKLQINFGVLQIGTESSATEVLRFSRNLQIKKKSKEDFCYRGKQEVGVFIKLQ